MRKLVLFAVAAVAAASSLTASGHVRTVREDRIWEYGASGTYWDNNTCYLHQLKFDGSTVEVNGKTYSRLAIVNTKAYRRRELNNGDWQIFLFNEEDRDDTMYYMREEDGKVYTLVRQDILPVNGGLNTIILTGIDPSDLPEDERADELLVYDWNRQDGETVAYPRDMIYNWSVDPEDPDNPIMYPYEGTLCYDTPIMVAGEECKVMHIEQDGFTWPEISFIEGIGPTFNGTVGSINFDMITGIPDNSREPALQCTLNRVFDSEGNVIYEKENAWYPSDNTYGYQPTVRDGRVWEYRSYGGHPDSDRNRGNYVYHFISFDGDVMEFDHRAYRVARIIRKVTTETSTDVPEFIVSDEVCDTPLYAMCEEKDRVYVLLDGEGEYVTHIGPDTDTSGFHNKLLYDWTLGEGDLWTYDMFEGMSPEFCPTVSYEDPVMIGGEECRVMNIDGISLVEGLGTTFNGSLGSYTFERPTCLEPWINTERPGIDSSLVRVYDSEDNLLYGSPFVSGNSVDGIEADAAGSDAPVYDVFGRRIDTTVPGSVYIRGGKKFVAR
ncbi:MAG: hypothetical protein K2L59_09740 [Muribaculaceae bacterium]|nr:hypothetical protein [Muribaculaceae bacterium]